jgi:DNA-binding response OmpR family regulator
VEDGRLARSALQLILQLEGYNVRVAGTGQRAVRVLAAFHPQVVIMDWRLPGISGEHLCREIRRRSPAIPIILISSSDEAFTSHVEVAARLRKPLDVVRLRAIVAEQLSADRPGRPRP